MYPTLCLNLLRARAYTGYSQYFSYKTMGKYLKLGIVLLLVFSVVAFVFLRQGPQSFVFAWVLNFALMMAVFYYTENFKPLLTSAYYNAKSWEAGGAVYKWLGVNIFRKILVLIGWEKVIRAASPVKKNLEAIKHLEYGTRKAEFGHIVIFFVVLAMNFFVVFNYGFAKSVPLLSLNIIFNVYPIILQRYNRPRLQRAIALQQARR